MQSAHAQQLVEVKTQTKQSVEAAERRLQICQAELVDALRAKQTF